MLILSTVSLSQRNSSSGSAKCLTAPSVLPCYCFTQVSAAAKLPALTWADVDLKEATITVHSGYNFKDKKIKDPKTEAGVGSLIFQRSLWTISKLNKTIACMYCIL